MKSFPSFVALAVFIVLLMAAFKISGTKATLGGGILEKAASAASKP